MDKIIKDLKRNDCLKKVEDRIRKLRDYSSFRDAKIKI